MSKIYLQLVFWVVCSLSISGYASASSTAPESMNNSNKANAAQLTKVNASEPQNDIEKDYLQGLSAHLAQNYAQAAKWFQKAANQGDADAQNNLGVMYGLGQGVTRSYSQCYIWASLAATGGEKPDMRDLCKKELTTLQLTLAQQKASVMYEKITTKNQ